jgi:hypothetical protein
MKSAGVHRNFFQLKNHDWFFIRFNEINQYFSIFFICLILQISSVNVYGQKDSTIFQKSKIDSIKSSFKGINLKDAVYFRINKNKIDSVKSTPDSLAKKIIINRVHESAIKLKKSIKTSGTIRNSSYYSTDYLFGQEIPLFYNRTFVNFTINVGGLPINSGFTYSTEDSRFNRQMGMFQLQINQNHILEFLKSRAPNIEKQKLNSEYSDSISRSLENSIKFTSELIEKLNNPDYQSEIEKYKEIIDNAQKDSAYAQKKKIKTQLAQDKLDKYNIQNSKIDSLEKVRKILVQKLAYLKALKDYDYNLNEVLNDSINDRTKGIEKYKPNGIYNILSKVKNFGIGDIYPEYSKIIMNGFMMRGIQTDFQFRNFYIGYSGGITNNIGNQSPMSIFTNKSKIHAGHIGIRSVDESSIGIVMLSGETQQPNIGSITNFPNRSQVIGVKLNLNILSIGIFEFERAISSTYRTNPEIKTNEFLNTFKKSSYNSSTYARLFGHINETNTKYSFTYLRSELYFYSIANPLQRPDCQRFEFRTEQGLKSNKITLIFGLRKENDNLSGLKKYSTFNNLYELGGKMKFKKSRLSLIHKTSIITNSISTNQILNLKTYNLTYSRNDKFFANPLISTLNYNFISFMGQLDTLANNSHLFNYTITYFLGPKIVFRNFQNFVLPQEDTKNNLQYELTNGITIQINKFFSVDLQHGFSNYKNVDLRNRLKTTCTYKIKKVSISGNAEYQIVNSSLSPNYVNKILILGLDLVIIF